MDTNEKAVLAEQLRGWARTLEGPYVPRADAMPNIIATMREVADRIAPTAEVCRKVRFTRYWSDDAEYVVPRQMACPGGLNPISAWWAQVHAEVVGAADHANGLASADVTLVSDTVRTTPKGNGLIAHFEAEVCLTYGFIERSFTNDAEVIQHFLYDEGGVSGDFTIFE